MQRARGLAGVAAVIAALAGGGALAQADPDLPGGASAGAIPDGTQTGENVAASEQATPQQSAPDAAAATAATGAPDLTAPVLVLDFDRAFATSEWGRTALAEMQDAAREIEAENTRLEQQLTTEERALTAERATLSPAEFRAKAEAFDARAQTIRRERAAVRVEFQTREQATRNAFIQATLPVAAEIMQELGAAVVLDRQQTLLAANRVDITESLVERMDRALGAGPGFADAEAQGETGEAETGNDPRAPASIPDAITPRIGGTEGATSSAETGDDAVSGAATGGDPPSSPTE